jgi:hypothetical protein
MGNQWDQSDDELEDDEETRRARKPGPRQQMRQLEKDNTELRDQVAKLQGQVRTTSIADVIAAKGLDPKIAHWVSCGLAGACGGDDRVGQDRRAT